MSGRTLVVVDIQPGFVASAWTLPAVLAAVRQAAEDGAPVVVVRYDTEGAGPLDERLLSLLDELKVRYVIATKYGEDGSAEVEAACVAAGFPTELFDICGVSTDCCIGQTAAGLADRLQSSLVRIITGACGCSDIRYDWSRFPQRPNIIFERSQR